MPDADRGLVASSNPDTSSHQPHSGTAMNSRVLYLIEDEQVTIIITSVTHRADAYHTR
jgi:mRNA-degrading endonuclease RelE of RelBE toxin-antitoxin system